MEMTIILNLQQCACLRPWCHRPGGKSMMACGNIIKEDQDCSTVESRKPATPFDYLPSYDLHLRQ